MSHNATTALNLLESYIASVRASPTLLASSESSFINDFLRTFAHITNRCVPSDTRPVRTLFSKSQHIFGAMLYFLSLPRD